MNASTIQGTTVNTAPAAKKFKAYRSGSYSASDTNSPADTPKPAGNKFKPYASSSLKPRKDDIAEALSSSRQQALPRNLIPSTSLTAIVLIDESSQL
jgi:hypothetical protein